MIRVIHLGLGDIGKATIEGILAQPKLLKLVGVVDIKPELAGKSLRAVMGAGKAGAKVPGLVICGSIAEVLRRAKADVATMTTGSHMPQVTATLEELIDAKVHVVSSCEELAFADFGSKKIAAALDRRARKAGVAIVGTGVNPGFAMDGFALACTAPCTKVRRITVVRTLDAAKRRRELQKKIGAGMSVAAVNSLIRQNKIGHVGLAESVAMIAAGLGWKLQGIRQKFTPIAAERAVSSRYFQIEAGQVRGMHMTAAGIVGGKRLIELDLTMAFDAQTFDEVIVEGDPRIVVRTTTGFPGEASTVGLVVNCLHVIGGLEPGLRTMLDVLRVRGVGA